MRTLGVHARVPVEVQVPLEDYGDGADWDEPRTVLAQVQQETVTTRDDTGSFRTRPLVLLLDHAEEVPVGARITVDGATHIVSKSKPVRGAWGVVHHQEVTAS